MMQRGRRIVRGAAIAMAFVGYMVASHLVLTAPSPAGPLAVAFAVLPLFGVALLVGWPAHRWLTLAGLIVAAVLLRHEAVAIGEHMVVVYLIQNISANGALLLIFGASLARGREPLCSRVAGMVRGWPLQPEVARYTRQVTIAWTIFFATMIALSLALYRFATVEAWSVFANLLATPLVGAMFVVEYAVRRRVLRDVPHAPLTAALRAWWESGLSAPRR